ncbi:hypothetical protein HOLleu_30576 [Holothuria leucospilota]|uniref:Uncharacterized protein n=1 Tax=Holothuria leucospilota TaxID=206669 RepID=A0A9Q1BKJ1_HOLLE|nr:hypothetical protein HOLleu_30576 [Holothuria leucospilota]
MNVFQEDKIRNPSGHTNVTTVLEMKIEKNEHREIYFSPTWKCRCKVIYNCGGENEDSRFPEDGAADSGCIKDLAPGDYPMNIAGKRWRRNIWNSKQYCQRECDRRLNAFLCLDDDGDFTDYSYAAVCLKLYFDQAVTVMGGGDRPCCEIYLQWGPDWCDEYWYRSIGNLYCYVRDTSSLPGTGGVTSFAFGVESCDAGDDDDYNWCPVDPVCPPPVPPG